MKSILNSYQKSELESLYKTGSYNYVQLASYFKVGKHVVQKYMKLKGYKAKSQSELQRKYPIKEDFFDKIDSEEKAYVLGFLYADGYNNTKKYAVALSLKEDDKIILQKINNLIQPTKPLFYVKMFNSGYENSKNQWRLTISNKHISKRLVELGCEKAKTHNITFPTEEQVPQHLQRHFIRGYFDGDGYISNTPRSPKLSIMGTLDFLLEIQKLIKTNRPLKHRHKERDGNVRALELSGKELIIRFRDWMYKDSTIYLERKKERFFKF
jgi:DNA-binding transcriptional regulator WhiA